MVLRVLVLTLVLSIPCIVSARQSFEDFKKQQETGYTNYQNEVEKGVLASVADYENFRQKEIEAFESFKKEMEALWGDYKERTQKDWVEYKQNGHLRSSVDFEKGKARIEIIVDKPEDIAKAKAEMKEALVKTFEDKGSEREFPMKDVPVKAASPKPILKAQLPIPVDSPKEKEKFAEKISRENVQTKQVKGADGNDRTVVFVDFDLAPDHLQKRAKEFEDLANKMATENGLSPALVFAIIHTESYFNPLAKSPVNAYGLMQVVPTSGGRDAYRKVHKKDGVPTADYLFTPDKNVQLGTVYLVILASNYFKDVSDKATREYLSICAYNTGAGNVAKAYNGTFNIKKAIPDINKKSAQENYDFLIKNLPYQETRDYLKKVNDRKAMYEKWMKD